MSRVELTERWIDQRLDALAAALHLVGPVRDGFAFPADLAFYRQCTESIVTLQKAARRIIDHIGLRCESVVVLWKRDITGEATSERDDGNWFITIDGAFKSDGLALGAILAREVCQILLVERKLARFGLPTDRIDRDLSAMLTGLGPLLLNALTETEGTLREIRSLGELRPHLLHHAHARVVAALRLGHRLATDYVRPPASTGVTFAWVRASRRALPFQPTGAHAIVRCVCGQRLRVPTGKIGRSTCPACKSSRELDGRLCPIAPLAASVALAKPTLPRKLGVAGLWLAIAKQPPLRRATAWLVIAALAVIATVSVI